MIRRLALSLGAGALCGTTAGFITFFLLAYSTMEREITPFDLVLHPAVMALVASATSLVTFCLCFFRQNILDAASRGFSFGNLRAMIQKEEVP